MDQSSRSPYSSWSTHDLVSTSSVSEKPLIKKQYSFVEGTKAMFYSGPLNLLLPAIPIAIICYFANANPGVTFALSLLGTIFHCLKF